MINEDEDVREVVNLINRIDELRDVIYLSSGLDLRFFYRGTYIIRKEKP